MGSRALVIGAGALGGWVESLLQGEEIEVVSTRTTASQSCRKFNLFHDDPKELIEGVNPAAVFFCAASERNADPDELKSRFSALCQAVGARRFIYVSSDGVFGGEEGLYKELDEPRPITPYGVNLKICEEVVRETPNHLLVRCSYLYGKDREGRDDPRTAELLAAAKEGRRIERWSNVFKGPEQIETVARGIVELGLSSVDGIIHIAGARVSVFDFARLRLLEQGVASECVIPTECCDPAIPKDTSLDCYRLRTLIYKRHTLNRVIR